MKAKKNLTLRGRVLFATIRRPPTTRICMVEVDDAVSRLKGEHPSYVCYRLQPILKPHCFRSAIHVVPRSQANDLGDYAIRLRLFRD